MPDILAWPVDKAVAECDRAGFVVQVHETAQVRQRLLCPELRVVRAEAIDGQIHLTVAKAQTEPAMNQPPGQ